MGTVLALYLRRCSDVWEYGAGVVKHPRHPRGTAWAFNTCDDTCSLQIWVALVAFIVAIAVAAGTWRNVRNIHENGDTFEWSTDKYGQRRKNWHHAKSHDQVSTIT